MCMKLMAIMSLLLKREEIRTINQLETGKSCQRNWNANMEVLKERGAGGVRGRAVRGV